MIAAIFERHLKPERVVSILMCAAAVLALVMAFTEAVNDRPDLWRGPPDEYAHRSAARYYIDHWAPPRVGDPATLDSYSRDYGFSYINDTDPAYFFGGKFAALISPLVPNQDRALRLFNVTLLALLALLCTRRPSAWPVFVPLLLTPQAWYIFSYFNGDALPLFLTIALAYELAAPESGFNRYLDRPDLLRGIGWTVGAGVLLACLVLSKKNYYVFLAFLPAAFAARRLGVGAALLAGAGAIAAAALQLQWLTLSTSEIYALAVAGALLALLAVFAPASTRPARTRVIVKLIVLALIASALVLGRHVMDAAINGSIEQKRQAQNELQEMLAKPQYKPSQIYQSKNQEATYYGLELRARGTPLKDIFGPVWSWHTKTFATLTGSYGWLTHNSPKPYGILLLLGYVGVFAVYAWAVARSKDITVATSFMLVAGFAILTVAVAIYHAWVNDFQAQGRYLFPILGMLSMGLMHARRWLPTKAMTASVSACFLLSAYSFIFIGLRDVERHF